MLLEIDAERRIGLGIEVMLSVAQRHVPQLSVPLEILFELAVHRTVNVETLLLDGFHIARQVILLTELVITVRIQSDPRIHRSHDGIPVPGLEAGTNSLLESFDSKVESREAVPLKYQCS